MSPKDKALRNWYYANEHKWYVKDGGLYGALAFLVIILIATSAFAAYFYYV